MQAFAWRVARNYGLHSPGPATSAGALDGGRHIGQLCNILERYGVTPDRYTLETLRAELDEALTAARIRPLENHDKRDRIAHFAWMLAKLQAFTRGETRRERQLREQEERIRARAIAADQARQRAAQQAAALEEAEAARAAFFADHHRSSARARSMSPTARASAARDLVTSLIGTAPLHQQSRELQQLVGDITTLGRSLVDHGWNAAHQVAGQRARWQRDDDVITIEIHGLRCLITPPAVELPPAIAGQLQSLTSRQ